MGGFIQLTTNQGLRFERVVLVCRHSEGNQQRFIMVKQETRLALSLIHLTSLKPCLRKLFSSFGMLSCLQIVTDHKKCFFLAVDVGGYHHPTA